MTETDARPERRQRARRRSGGRRTSLFAHGEPMVWLTGGALALSLVMIVGLLGLVVWFGARTFWPGPVVQVETVDGRVAMGELAAEGTFVPEGQVFDALPEADRESALAEVAAAGGEARRRMLRTGNYDLDGTHFQWFSDFELTGERLPEWALVIERQTWGRFYGTPLRFELGGQVVADRPAEVWARFEEHHEPARKRWEHRRGLEEHDIGRVNDRITRARLRARQAELDHGEGSPRHLERLAEAERVEAEVSGEFERIQSEIASIKAANEQYQLIVATADGREQAIQVSEIVRAYPANRLGWKDKLGVYVSRVAEFLLGDPREANSEGGVRPAIFGTVAMTLIMSIVVVPFGVLAALYLREYAKPGPIVSIVRIAINNLAGVPSIVFGVFGLGFFCYIIGASLDELFYEAALPTPTFGRGGLLWASLTLALLTLPVVIVPTEEALAAVPGSMREGSYACGATKWQTIRRIVLPRAMPGIMTGLILALARGAGEVAPLMLVGAVKLAPELPIDGEAPFVHPSRSFMHLGFHIYDLGFQSQNSEAAKPMVYTTTLLLIGLVVLLNVLAIGVRARLRKRFGGSHV